MKFDTSITNLFMITINLLLQKMHRFLIFFLSILFFTKLGSSKLKKCWMCKGIAGECDSKKPEGGTKNDWIQVNCTTGDLSILLFSFSFSIMIILNTFCSSNVKGNLNSNLDKIPK